MDRRRILLIIAAVVAALGTLLVFLYVRSADARAQDSVDAVQVLTASQPIAAGESYDAALAAGKIVPRGVPRSQLLANVQSSADALKGYVALQAILPNEQIVADKFGANAAEVSSPLGIPDKEMAISVNIAVGSGAQIALMLLRCWYWRRSSLAHSQWPWCSTGSSSARCSWRSSSPTR